jgi:hypothetical protein
VKTEARLFLILTGFVWLAAIMYGLWSHFDQGHVEVVGFVALLLSGGLLGICGSFFQFVSRRIDPRPEDRNDAEIAEAAGDFGFFSPGSYWPLGLGSAVTVIGFGLAFVQIWLVIVGVVYLLFNVGGLLFEYYTGGNSSSIT